MMLKMGSVGDDVRALQLQLAAHGFASGKVDGIFGTKTERAVLAFQGARGLALTGVVDNATWTELLKSPPAVKLPGVEFHDRRKFAAHKHHGFPTHRRPLSSVTGICLHQAAVDLGERPERYDTGGAHVFISRAGRVIWEHDWETEVAAANGWNSGTISIEVSGRYCGLVGDESTYWRNPEAPHLEPQDLTPESARSLEQVIRWICGDVEARGGKIRVRVAHRQASATRRSDPGEAIWKASQPVADELDLGDGGPGFKLGDGRPIPEGWDSRRVGFKY